MNVLNNNTLARPQRGARGFSRRRLAYTMEGPVQRFIQPFMLLEVQQFMNRWGFNDNGSYEILTDLMTLDALRRLVSHSELKQIAEHFKRSIFVPHGRVVTHALSVFPAFKLLFSQRVTSRHETPAHVGLDFFRGYMPPDAVVLCKDPIKHPLYEDFPVEIIPFIETSLLPSDDANSQITKDNLAALSSQISAPAKFERLLQILAPMFALSRTVEADDYKQLARGARQPEEHPAQTDNDDDVVVLSNDEPTQIEASSVTNTTTRHSPYTRVTPRRRITMPPTGENSHRAQDIRSREIFKNIQSQLCELTAARDLDTIKEIHLFTKMLKQVLQRP